jgi:hypothetical protein
MMRAFAAVGVALALALAGCTSLRSTVSDALDQAVSATGTAALAVALADDGRTPRPAADTALADALTELDDAATTLVDAGPAGPADSALRRDALAAIRGAADAVLAARDDLSAGRDLAADEAGVRAARDALTKLADPSGAGS